MRAHIRRLQMACSADILFALPFSAHPARCGNEFPTTPPRRLAPRRAAAAASPSSAMLRSPALVNTAGRPTTKLVADFAAVLDDEARSLPAVAFMFSYQRYATTLSILAQIQAVAVNFPIGALRLLELLIRRRPRRYDETLPRKLTARLASTYAQYCVA